MFSFARWEFNAARGRFCGESLRSWMCVLILCDSKFSRAVATFAISAATRWKLLKFAQLKDIYNSTSRNIIICCRRGFPTSFGPSQRIFSGRRKDDRFFRHRNARYGVRACVARLSRILMYKNSWRVRIYQEPLFFSMALGARNAWGPNLIHAKLSQMGKCADGL